MSFLTTKDNVDVVVVSTKLYYADLISLLTSLQSDTTPRIFQLNKPYNINNIIIIGEIMLVREEEYVDDEYIDSRNDPYQVEKIIQEDYVFFENEEIAQHEEILSSPIVRNDVAISNHDHLMEEKLLDALRRGKLR